MTALDLNSIENALWETEKAVEDIEFVIRFESFCNKDQQSKLFPDFLKELNCPVLCRLPEGDVNLTKFFTEDDVVFHAGMAVSTAIGVSAQVLNRAYETAGIRLHPKPQGDSQSVRCYVAQVRNLFQHSMGSPLWDIRPKKQIQIEVSMGGRTKVFEYSQIGGLKFWLDVAAFAIQNIRNQVGID